MPLLASFLFLLPQPTTTAPPVAEVVVEDEVEPEDDSAQVWRDPFAPILPGAPRRIGTVLGEDGPRVLLQGPDGNIYVGALLSGAPPVADRAVVDERLDILLGQP